MIIGHHGGSVLYCCFWTKARNGAVFSDGGKGKDELFMLMFTRGYLGGKGEIWRQPEDIFVETTSSCPRLNQSHWWYGNGTADMGIIMLKLVIGVNWGGK